MKRYRNVKLDSELETINFDDEDLDFSEIEDEDFIETSEDIENSEEIENSEVIEDSEVMVETIEE